MGKIEGGLLDRHRMEQCRAMKFQKVQLKPSSICTTLMSQSADATRDHIRPHLETVMDTILNGVADEARAIHAEYKTDYGTGREYVRIWKCVDAQPYTSKGSRDFSGRVSGGTLLGIKNLREK